MVEKDYKLYGTKILNLKTQEIGLLICLWKNKFADKTVDFATCVDKTGKRYNIDLDNIRMILKNKRTRERIQLSYTEFQNRFAKELKIALGSYIQTEESKYYFRINKTLESDFYFNLQWNFNHYGNSNWYIERYNFSCTFIISER